MANFDLSWEMIKRHEGTTFIDIPDDRGGPTKFGITMRSMPRGSTRDDIANLTEESAKGIYRTNFWTPIHGDSIENQKWATILFDQSVLHGISGAGLLLRIVDKGQSHPQLDFDFLKACAKSAIGQVKQDPGQAKFLSGWLHRLNDLEAFLFDLHYDF